MCGTAYRDPAEDVAAFKQDGGQVLIGTPGRLSDFMKRCAAVDTRRLEVSSRRSFCELPQCDHVHREPAEVGGNLTVHRGV